MTKPGLTNTDREKLADMAENGTAKYSNSTRGDDQINGPAVVVCRHCGHEWEYNGDRHIAQCHHCRRETPLIAEPRGVVTQPMCNAIREAARDGLKYRTIADLFSFVTDKRIANTHATGRCSHDDGVPPVDKRVPSTPDVTPEECADLRARYDRGESVTDLEQATDRDVATVYRHVVGDCSH